MKIIKEGKIPEKHLNIIECKKCNSIFDYNENDIISEINKYEDVDYSLYLNHYYCKDRSYFVKCPICGDSHFIKSEYISKDIIPFNIEFEGKTEEWLQLIGWYNDEK